MIVIISPTYGQVIIPFTQDQEERYKANVPRYARDNTQTGNKDNIGSGAIINPAEFNFNVIINNNDGSILSNYNIEQIRLNLISIYNNSELVQLIFGESNSLYFDVSTPTSIQNCVISDLVITANSETGRSYNVQISFSEQILVDTVWNPQVIDVPPNTTADGNDRSQKALTPQNNGVSTPQNIPSDNSLWSNTVQDAENL